MKVTKLRALLMLLLAVGVIFNGCNPDGDTVEVLEPTIVFNNTGGALIQNTSVEIGTNIAFNVVFTKGNDGKKLNIVRLTRNLGDGSFVAVPASNVTPTPANATEYATTGNITDVNADTYTIAIAGITSTTTGTHVYRFYVEDKDGNKLTRDITITWTGPQNNIIAPATASNITVNNTDAFVCLTCVSEGGAVVRNEATANSNTALADLRYFYSTATSTQNLISTNVLATSAYNNTDAEWDNATNTTNMRMLSTFDAAAYDTVANQATLEAMFNAAGTAGEVVFANNPNGARFGGATFANNAVIVFRTQSGKFGALKITSTAANSATFNVKMQN